MIVEVIEEDLSQLLIDDFQYFYSIVSKKVNETLFVNREVLLSIFEHLKYLM